MIGRFIVKVANLAEAEGRAAKRGAMEVAARVCGLFAATALMVAGILALARGFYFILTEQLGASQSTAWLVVGGFLLLASAVCWWRATRETPTGITREEPDELQPPIDG